VAEEVDKEVEVLEGVLAFIEEGLEVGVNTLVNLAVVVLLS
jgi:hypothetical protein